MDKELNVPKTGDIRIDALEHRTKWTTPQISYSFFSDAKGGPYYSHEKDVAEISSKMKSYVRHILEDVIEPLINVDFVEVEDSKNNYGQLRYMFSTSTETATTGALTRKGPSAGDVFLHLTGSKNLRKGQALSATKPSCMKPYMPWG